MRSIMQTAIAAACVIVASVAIMLPANAKVVQHKSSSTKTTTKKTATKVSQKTTQTLPQFPRPNGARVYVGPPRSTTPPSSRPPYYLYRDTAEYYRAMYEYNRRQNVRSQAQLRQAELNQNYTGRYGQYVQQYGSNATRVDDFHKCDSCPRNLNTSVLNNADERRYWAAVHFGHALTLRGRKMNGDLFTNREELVDEAMRCANIMEYLRTHRNPETNIAP